jgi:glutamine synthetase
MSTMNLSEIQKLVRDKDIEFIRFEQTGTHGISRFKTIPARATKKASPGIAAVSKRNAQKLCIPIGRFRPGRG